MARKVIWAPRALVLLEEAASHIEIESPPASRQLVESAIEAADSLVGLSERGRFVPELRDSIHRELFVGRYRLIYRVATEHVAIVAFVHGARDFRSWWNRYRREAVQPN